MLKKYWRWKVVGFFAIVVMGLVFKYSHDFFLSNNRDLVAFNNHERRKIVLGDETLTVEVVNTPESITQGLSAREEIGADGMLFVFAGPGTPSFWMKDMKFDLDLIWIRDGRVVDITRHVPRPDLDTPLSELPRYQPSEPVDIVLEVEAGKIGEWGIKTGDNLSP